MKFSIGNHRCQPLFLTNLLDLNQRNKNLISFQGCIKRIFYVPFLYRFFQSFDLKIQAVGFFIFHGRRCLLSILQIHLNYKNLKGRCRRYLILIGMMTTMSMKCQKSTILKRKTLMERNKERIDLL